MSARDSVSFPDDALCEVIEGVDTALGLAATAGEWSAISPLVAHLAEQTRLTDADLAIIAELPHLQAVCHRPRLLLRTTEDRVPVGRARRVPARAVTDLAARPMDWERRTFTGVAPSRVLAVQIDDLWDLYENRVAARLVDHLLQVITLRLSALRGLSRLMDDERSYVEEAQGAHRRASRLYALWGEACAGHGLHRQLKDTTRQIERLFSTLQGLLDSPLYRAIPKSAAVDATLRTTNVLSNDQHYRHVARLWRRTLSYWRKPSAKVLSERRGRWQLAFDRYARLVVVRALAVLGLECDPDGVGLAASEGALRLDGRHAITLRWSEAGGLMVGTLGATLHIVPWLVGLKRLDEEGITGFLAGRGADTLVVASGHPGDLGPAAGAISECAGTHGWPAVALISPWTIDSIERVARAIGLWLARRALPAFPVSRRIKVPSVVELPPFLRDLSGTAAVIRPIEDHERTAFMQTLAKARSALSTAEHHARAARRPFDVSQLTAVGALEELVAEASVLDVLRCCPVCDDGGATFEPRLASGGVSTWWSQCDSCSSAFGTRVCRSCRKSYPVLILDGGQVDELPTDARRTSDWLDRTFGKDVWAAPSGPDGAYQCTECVA